MHRHARRLAFSLLEMLVVLAITAALAAIVAPSMLRHLEDARVQQARAQVEAIDLALTSFRLDVGRYPTSEEGLLALTDSTRVAANRERWRGPYLRRRVPLDPWGQPYVFACPGMYSGDGFDLYTLGRDRTVGGTGDAVDVTSWGGPVLLGASADAP